MVQIPTAIILTSEPDVWTGTNNAEWVQGLVGNDSLAGGGGDDILDGSAGNDLLGGGAGNDVAVFSGSFSDYSFWRSPLLLFLGEMGHIYQVTDNRPGSPDGSESVFHDIERAQFNDQARAFDYFRSPVHRFFDVRSNGHFYTDDDNEYQQILNNPNSTYVYEGAQWRVPDRETVNTTDVY